MATHSSILAWRIPGTEELGGLPSGVVQSRTRLKQLSSSSSRHPELMFFTSWIIFEIFFLFSCSVSLWPHELSPARLLCLWGFSRQEYWNGLPFPRLLHCRRILYHLSHQGNLVLENGGQVAVFKIEDSHGNLGKIQSENSISQVYFNIFSDNKEA